MLIAFLLILTMDGVDVDTENMYFRDIYRCSFFAKEIEKSANTTWAGDKYKWKLRAKAWCKPVFVSRETKFWD